MAESKNNKKLTPKEIKELEEFEKEYMKLYAKVNGTKGVKKTSKKYKANKGLMLRLKASAAIFLMAMGSIQVMAQDARATNTQEEQGIYTLSSIVSTDEQQTPKIEVDGIEIELDDCSIAIVQGQIQAGENNVFAFDQEGNIIEGTVSSKNLNGSIKISKEDIEDYVIYQVVSPEGADLIKTGEEISNVSYGDCVLGKEQHNEYVDVLYPTEEGILRGEINEESLELVYELATDEYQKQGLIKMVVDTSVDQYAKLNFRSNPNYEKYSIMMQIPNGTIIDSTGETIVAEGREWTKIEYEGETGWVASEYLKEFMRQEQQYSQEMQQEQQYSQEIQQEQQYSQEIQQEQQYGQELQQEQDQYIQELREQDEAEETARINMSGGITTVDVSTMTADQLRALLENGIPSELSINRYEKYNTQGVAGNIYGVQIKIGASTYGKGAFKQTDYDAYRDLVAVCEELGVPYGFYFYATSTDIEQGKMELEYVQNTIEELEKEFDMEYNQLPFTWDRELAGTKDRQYGKDITNVVAYQINETQSRGISKKVLLYTAGRLVDENDSDRMMDLEKLKASLTNPEDFAIWLCGPVTRDGNQRQSTVNYIDMIENRYQIPVVSEQRYLDMNSPTGGKMDVNSMDSDYYDEIIGEKDNAIDMEYDER